VLGLRISSNSFSEITVSLPLFGEDVVFLQRLLKCSGLYAGKLDGIWGPKTDKAVNAFERKTAALAEKFGVFDPGSERKIRTLAPEVQALARRFLGTVLSAGVPARIISGTRTYAEQNALYRQGRFGNKGLRVTQARGGQSNHNFGLAWDIGIFRDGKYLGESPLYRQAAEVGLLPELEWGGHWQTFPDFPHYQLRTGHTVTIVRQRFESGMAYV
jgi:peptidoglycan L-alanyl-D-glutamate endopeptidase CwlK